MTDMVVRSGEVASLVLRHELAFSGAHTDLDRDLCVCSGYSSERPPNFTGETCSSCGGMAVRTGTCTTCTTCGTTGGCG